MSEYITSIDYVWKDDEVAVETNAVVVVLNDSKAYEQMHEDESFDERVFFYFADMAEFQASFDPSDDCFEFTTVRETS